jgi:hypothetical protein
VFLPPSAVSALKLVMMKHSSVFINDAKEAGRLIKDMPSKGPIYGAFRYDVNVPDLLFFTLNEPIQRQIGKGQKTEELRIPKKIAFLAVLKGQSICHVE